MGSASPIRHKDLSAVIKLGIILSRDVARCCSCPLTVETNSCGHALHPFIFSFGRSLCWSCLFWL